VIHIYTTHHIKFSIYDSYTYHSWYIIHYRWFRIRIYTCSICICIYDTRNASEKKSPKYSQLHLECHSISISNLNLIGLFSTECGKRGLENLTIKWNLRPTYSVLHLECHFFFLRSQSIIKLSRCFLPHSVVKRRMRLRLEIEIEWLSKCNWLYMHHAPVMYMYVFTYILFNMHHTICICMYMYVYVCICMFTYMMM